MKAGLVLSGGAAWGLANIGILQIFERENISFQSIAGSSMGAIVAGVYALGVPLRVIEETAAKISLLSVARCAKTPFVQGFHSGLLHSELESILLSVIGESRIRDTKIPFVCVAGKVNAKIEWERIIRPGFAKHFTERVTPYVFPPETRMIDALLASSAIPVVFAPVRVGSDEFVDLVHFGSIPARQLKAMLHPDIIIGTDTNPRYGFLQRLLPAPWRDFIDHGHRELQADMKACDLIIHPVMPAAIFRFDRSADFIVSGRTAAEKCLPQLTSLLAQGFEMPSRSIS